MKITKLLGKGKRFLAAALVLVLLVGLFPATSLAAEPTPLEKAQAAVSIVLDFIERGEFENDYNELIYHLFRDNIAGTTVSSPVYGRSYTGGVKITIEKEDNNGGANALLAFLNAALFSNQLTADEIAVLAAGQLTEPIELPGLVKDLILAIKPNFDFGVGDDANRALFANLLYITGDPKTFAADLNALSSAFTTSPAKTELSDEKYQELEKIYNEAYDAEYTKWKYTETTFTDGYSWDEVNYKWVSPFKTYTANYYDWWVDYYVKDFSEQRNPPKPLPTTVTNGTETLDAYIARTVEPKVTKKAEAAGAARVKEADVIAALNITAEDFSKKPAIISAGTGPNDINFNAILNVDSSDIASLSAGLKEVVKLVEKLEGLKLSGTPAHTVKDLLGGKEVTEVLVAVAEEILPAEYAEILQSLDIKTLDDLKNVSTVLNGISGNGDLDFKALLALATKLYPEIGTKYTQAVGYVNAFVPKLEGKFNEYYKKFNDNDITVGYALGESEKLVKYLNDTVLFVGADLLDVFDGEDKKAVNDFFGSVLGDLKTEILKQAKPWEAGYEANSYSWAYGIATGEDAFDASAPLDLEGLFGRLSEDIKDGDLSKKINDKIELYIAPASDEAAAVFKTLVSPLLGLVGEIDSIGDLNPARLKVLVDKYIYDYAKPSVSIDALASGVNTRLTELFKHGLALNDAGNGRRQAETGDVTWLIKELLDTNDGTIAWQAVNYLFEYEGKPAQSGTAKITGLTPLGNKLVASVYKKLAGEFVERVSQEDSNKFFAGAARLYDGVASVVDAVGTLGNVEILKNNGDWETIGGDYVYILGADILNTNYDSLVYDHSYAARLAKLGVTFEYRLSNASGYKIVDNTIVDDGTGAASIPNNNATLSVYAVAKYGGKTWEALLATKTIVIAVPVVTGIDVDDESYTPEYFVGNELNLSGLIVTATYSDGTTGPLDTSEYTTDPLDGTELEDVGSVTVIVTYVGNDDVTDEFYITVKALPNIQITEIAIDTQDVKKTYTAGEELNLAGLVVYATLTDITTNVVDSTGVITGGYTISPSDGTILTTANTTVTVTVDYNNNLQVSFNITVNQAPLPTLDSIAVTTNPTKRIYTAGETFSSAGMVVTATYDNGTPVDVTGYTIEPAGALTTGTTYVTISFGGKSTTVSITVNAAGPSGPTGDTGGGGGGGGGAPAATVPVVEIEENETALADLPDAFDDDNGKWSEPFINSLAWQGLVSGTGDRVFSPDAQMTRGSFITLLYKVFGKGATYDSGSTGFSDVVAGSYYEVGVAWGVDIGIASGSNDGTFNPNRPITREEMAQLIYNLALALDLDIASDASTTPYPDDAKISGYAKPGVYGLQAADIIHGDQSGNFNPKGIATRADSAVLIYNLMVKLGLIEDDYLVSNGETETDADKKDPVDTAGETEPEVAE